MCYPACSIILLGTLLLPVTAAALTETSSRTLPDSAGISIARTLSGPSGQSPSGVEVVARDSLTPLAGASLAADVDIRHNPMAEQAAMAVLLVGLAAALRRWQPGKRPRPSHESRT